MAQNNASERPAKEFDNPFFQQKMTHFYANISPHVVMGCLFFVAALFIPIGAYVVVISDTIFEIDVRYDDIQKCTRTSNQGVAVFTVGNQTFSQGCTTNAKFTLKQSLKAPIYIYYRLDPFYQNYRLYAQSINENQLSGSSYSSSDLSNCDPMRYPSINNITVGTQTTGRTGIVYAPCGSVAWTMFNDTISLWSVPTGVPVIPNAVLPSGSTPICRGDAFDARGNLLPGYATNCSKDGIAFSQDTSSRFSATPGSSADVWTGEGYTGNTSNPFFAAGWYANEAGHKVPLTYDLDFMVWARISPLGNIRKLYRKINQDLLAGTYAFRIDERFDAVSIEAEKHIILATTSPIGGKNYVLGGLYIAMGSLALVLACAFIGLYLARQSGSSPAPSQSGGR